MTTEIRFWNYGTKDKKVLISWNGFQEFKNHWIMLPPNTVENCRITIRMPENKLQIDFRGGATRAEIAQAVRSYIVNLEGEEGLYDNKKKDVDALLGAIGVG